MFKRVFQSISKALGPSAKATEAPPPKVAPAAAPKDKSTPPLEFSVEPVRASAKGVEAPKLPEIRRVIRSSVPPDELCGITAGMTKEQIRERLALLYKRYNRATSSLNLDLKDEAEIMLDAVVAMREKHFGPI